MNEMCRLVFSSDKFGFCDDKLVLVMTEKAECV